MEKMQSQQSEDNNQSIDAFATVMGHEHLGCLILYGRGVTKTTLKRKAHSEPYLSANDKMTQKQMEELEDASEDGGKIRRIKVTIHREVTYDILGRLNHMYHELQFD
ncbi:hypothetical protein H5410_060547 [Solanum commersonii]|uniref:Uncharacterized protein n=1 Tax=Solanum commersonii TaxID=4109 RepID=A0A9J5W5D1_SOLCO|nr:hypothetical protein H5410_060547 [Solanum commersonii]